MGFAEQGLDGSSVVQEAGAEWGQQRWTVHPAAKMGTRVCTPSTRDTIQSLGWRFAFWVLRSPHPRHGCASAEGGNAPWSTERAISCVGGCAPSFSCWDGLGEVIFTCVCAWTLSD